jgi:hypothetical protein
MLVMYTRRELGGELGMNMNEHAQLLGELVNNLLSLELVLRLFLLEKNSHRSKVDYFSLKIGDIVDEDEFTNYDTLGKLIDKYNDYVKSYDPALIIDKSLVSTRDALAHGRIARSRPEGSSRLLKFDKPDNNGRVRVTHSEEMDVEWFNRNKRVASESLEKVVLAGKQEQMKTFRKSTFSGP